MDDTKILLRSFSKWECCYVSRQFNRAAHDLAKLACRQIIEKTWEGDIPEAIHDVIMIEQSVFIWFLSMILFILKINNNNDEEKEKERSKNQITLQQEHIFLFITNNL